MSDTRQPLTVDVILSQTMEKLGVDTPTDMLRAVFDLVDRQAALDSAPVPVLVVDDKFNITMRRDLTILGLMSIIEAIQQRPAVGGA